MATVVVRYGEFFLKGKNRAEFKARLHDHLNRVLKNLPAKLQMLHARALVHVPDEHLPRTLEQLAFVFGVQSLSPCTLVEPTEEAIRDTCLVLARAWIERHGKNPRFKVDTRRSDKSFPVPSMELSRRIGSAVATELDLPVDVRHPEMLLSIEIGPQGSFVFTDTLPGAAGLPVGSAGRVNLLLSGGIDSPVAGWLAMKRGCRVDATYFHSFPFTGDKTREKVLDLGRLLLPWQGRMTVWIVAFTEVQKALRAAGPPNHAVVLYRRMMMRVAARLCERTRAKALVTGETLAQVSSQTLENLGAIESASPLPVLRPLITHDKLETVALAQKIGTYEKSIEPFDDCCSLFVPTGAVIRASARQIARAEARLDVEALAQALAADADEVVLS